LILGFVFFTICPKAFLKKFIAMTLLEIQKSGMNARANGVLDTENPYLKKLPDKEGHNQESWSIAMQAWQEKYDAWDIGWNLEDMARPFNH